MPVPATVEDLTTLEFEGLQTIAGFVGDAHPDFGAVRPLSHVKSESIILMDYVEAHTLRQASIAQSRLPILGRPRPHHPLSSHAWRNAGAWLRAYHEAPGHAVHAASKEARQSTKAELVTAFGAYATFLTDRLGARVTQDLVARGERLAQDAFSPVIRLVVGHGDYAMRNMFVDAQARITVFDPMPRWRMPYLEDLCRFLVGLRLSGLQLRSHGAAYSGRELDRLESLFLSGYFGGDEPPLLQLRCYQLLVCLDKWSALLEGTVRARRLQTGLRSALMLPANEYLRRECRRLLDLAEGSATPAREGR